MSDLDEISIKVAPVNWGAVGHERRSDHTKPELRVIGFRNRPKKHPHSEHLFVEFHKAGEDKTRFAVCVDLFVHRAVLRGFSPVDAARIGAATG